MKTQTPLAVSKLKDCIKELKRAEGYPSVKKRIADYELALKILSGETVKGAKLCPSCNNGKNLRENSSCLICGRVYVVAGA